MTTKKPSRNARLPRVTAPKSRKPRPKAEPESIPLSYGPDEQYRLYRLCICGECDRGKTPDGERCGACRGEGKVLDQVATCANPQAVGQTLVTLAMEGEFDECPFGLLDSEGEVGKKWLVKPWGPSPRNVSDAAKVLAKSKKGER